VSRSEVESKENISVFSRLTVARNSKDAFEI